MTVIERCAIRAKHTHTADERSEVHRFSEYWGWVFSDRCIRLHEDPDARRVYEEQFHQPPLLDSGEEFEKEHGYLFSVFDREAAAEEQAASEAAAIRAVACR